MDGRLRADTRKGRSFRSGSGNIDPLVSIEIAHAISWHAHHGVEETSAAARRNSGVVARTLEFRALLALVDGYGHIIERYTDYQAHEKKWGEYLSTLVADLCRLTRTVKPCAHILPGMLHTSKPITPAQARPFTCCTGV